MRVRAPMGRIGLCICLTGVMLAGSVAGAVAGPLSISAHKQLNLVGEGGFPSGISGSRVVWTDSDGDYEIVVGDALSSAPPRRLTTNTVDDMDPLISGDYVAWERDLTDDEIYARNLRGMVSVPITDNDQNDNLTAISGSRIVWEGPGSFGTENEIGLYDFGSGVSTYLTANDWLDTAPSIKGNKVVWVERAMGGDIVSSWDASSFIQSVLMHGSF